MPEAPVTLQVLAGSILKQSCTLPTSSARISPSSFLRSLSSCCSNLPLLLEVLSSPSFIFCYWHLPCSPLPSNHLFTHVCGVLAHVTDFPFFQTNSLVKNLFFSQSFCFLVLTARSNGRIVLISYCLGCFTHSQHLCRIQLFHSKQIFGWRKEEFSCAL